MVKILTVLVSTISNSQVFLLKKCEYFCKCKSHSHFFSKNISIYAIFNDQSFNDTLTNDIVSFEQLGPDIYLKQFPLPYSRFINIICFIARKCFCLMFWELFTHMTPFKLDFSRKRQLSLIEMLMIKAEVSGIN